MGWLFTQWSGTGPAHLEKSKRRELMKMSNIIMNYFVIWWKKYIYYIFYFYFGVLYIRLNLISFLSVTQVVRYPSLEGDWSSGDHVSVPGWVTLHIFIHKVTDDVRCSHLAADISDISCRAGLHLHFFFFVLTCLVIIDTVQQGDAQLRYHLCQVSAVIDLLCSLVSWLYCVRVLFKPVVMYLLVRLFSRQPCRDHKCPY